VGGGAPTALVADEDIGDHQAGTQFQGEKRFG